MQRRAVVTVRRPRARMVPSTSTSAFSQVGLVKSDWNGANRSAKVCEWNTKLSFNYYVHFLSIVVEEIKLLSTRLKNGQSPGYDVPYSAPLRCLANSLREAEG